ncbi:MAG: Uncharacterized protein LiPW41_586 [Parcubacteria group bacterium LiPW_41]|nr:MAG: Uncharacterized protein LiPW41_586 [Parcubacteria group bacterium LiPW_41]
MDYFKASRFFLFAAIFAVVIVTSSTLFPFIVGKYVFFRACVAFATIFFSLGILFQDQKDEMIKRMKEIIKHPLAIGVAAFVATFVLAGFFGVNPSASFWSNFERGEGGFQIISLGIFFFLSTILLRDWKAWKKFFILFITASALVMLYGVGAGLDMNGFVGEKFSTNMRFAGSLGNPAYIGTYMLFAAAFALICAFRAVTKEEKRWFFVIAGLAVFSSWASQTRGAFLGLAAALFVSLLFVAYNNQKYKKYILGVLGFLVVVSALLMTQRNNPTFQKIPGFRVFTISLQEQTAQTRLWTWNAALKGVKDRPVFGWGPENFSVVFDKYFDHRHYNLKTGGETWFDRAHSLYIDSLVQTGIVGFLGLLTMLGAFFVVWKKSVLLKGISIEERGVLLGLMIMYCVQGFVLFDILPTYIALFSFLAYMASRTQKESK